MAETVEKITIQKASEIMQKPEHFIRIGLQTGKFPFGIAIKTGSKYNYYISPKLFYEYVGQPS